MPIKHVVFDLDGTLVSSHETIYETTIYTLKLFGVTKEVPLEKFNNLIGYHFADMLPMFDIHLDDYEEFINVYKKHYFNFMDSSYLYTDVIETLTEMKKLGMKISLLTTKAQDQSERILNHFNITDYFDFIMGRRIGIAHKPSPEPLLFICKELNLSPSESLMIGDSELDVRCGKSAGSKTAAVTFGYRKKEILELEAPDFIIDNLISLKYILSDGNRF
jgi:HAD superfamily hydrolase (TIGR01549 family)